jgi:hypothetical protein
MPVPPATTATPNRRKKLILMFPPIAQNLVPVGAYQVITLSPLPLQGMLRAKESWLYETWASQEAVEVHESGAAFLRCKETLRPLVDPDSVLFGNCVPVKVLGYRIEPATAAGGPQRES